YRMAESAMRPQARDGLEVEFRAGADEEIVVVDALAIGQHDLIAGRIDGGRRRLAEPDAVPLHQRGNLEAGFLLAAPAHPDPGIRGREAETRTVADQRDRMIRAQRMAQFVGGTHA